MPDPFTNEGVVCFIEAFCFGPRIQEAPMEPGLFESKIYSINRKLLAELSIGSGDISSLYSILSFLVKNFDRIYRFCKLN